MMHRPLLLGVLLLLSFVNLRADDLHFYNINDIYGISIRETTSICKDTDGFIWVASKVGVLRLTDSDYRLYQLPYESTAVISVKVVCQYNALFAYTNQGQIFKYNTILDRFEPYINFAKLINATALWLFDLELDGRGGMWMASSYGLYYYKGGQYQKIDDVPGSVNDMTRYEDNQLIAAGAEGIYLVDMVQHQAKLWYKLSGVSPASLLLDTQMHRLWVGTLSNGLYYYDYAANEWHVSPIKNFPQQCVKDIELVSDSTIWCGIDGRGVWEISRDGSRLIQVYQDNQDNPLSLSGNGVYDIFYDRQGRVWVCTFTGGVSMTELRSPVVTHLQHRINDSQSLVNNHVHDLVEDRHGQLWMGTNSGLSLWNPQTNRWTTYFEEKGEEAYIILSLCEDEDGNIWVGTYAHGVYVIDSKHHQIIANHTRPTGILGKTGFVFDILKDRNGDMWLGGMSGEILKYSRRNHRFEVCASVPVYALEELDNRTLLLAGSYGMRTLDKETKALRTLLDDVMIQDMAVVQDKIWVATNGEGLVSYDMRADTIVKYNMRSGMPSNYINSVMYVDGYLWLGTESGLCRFNTIDKTITTYPSPVLSAESYNSDACIRMHNGMYAFGTSDGVIMFEPKSLNRQKPTGRIYIQDILLSGRSIRDDPKNLHELPLDSMTKVTLTYDRNNVTVEVLPLGNYSQTAQFSWMMQGFDKEWSELTDQRGIHYTNLNPGSYQLLIRLYNQELVSERTLNILITPPFWDTWWFLLLMVALIAAMLYVALRFYINRMNKQHAEDKLHFFTHTAHDLRTALTLIKAPIEELNRANDLSAHDRRYLDLAVEQTRRLTSVATQLLNFQKVDMGKEQFLPVMSDIVALVKSRISMFEALAASKHVVIKYEHDTATYRTAIDVDMMERVIDNLLSNAVKYSCDYAMVEVAFYSNTKEWRLIVRDYGIGISQKSQSKLFHEFYRSENAINAKIVGSGIGLLMAKRLVDLHNGKISVDSEEGQGTIFEIKIPYQYGEASLEPDKLPAISTQDLSDTHKGERFRILVVEDNDDLRRFMEQTLSPHFGVAAVADGAEAWAYVQQEFPDLIVSDIMMPNMDGFELCRTVKSTFETSHIPIILLTALSEKTDELRGLRLGAEDYVTKPFDMAVLVQRILSIIRNRRIVGARLIKTTQAIDQLVGMSAEPLLPDNTLNDEFAKRAVAMVIKHLDDTSFGKEEFAKAMHVSTSLLYKKLKALTGLSIVDFIKSTRLEHAMRLVKENRYNSSEIAGMCGFGSVSYFCTVFKQHFGQSPMDIEVD